MADVSDITPHLDRLDGDLDKLEDSLKPILSNLGEVASTLPLLDKAKLYVLATYSIETALFSALRLNGTDAKEHAVFKELARVRQYYEKIKKAEEPPEQRTQSVNTQAAIRFIKADLAGDNKDVDTKLKEQLAKERAKAAIQARMNKKRPAEDSDAASAVADLISAESSKAAGADSSAVNSAAEDGEVNEPDRKKSRKARGGKKNKKSKRDTQ
ncbi:exosome-associated family protein [Diaporthe amygdali]|uniref:exosome-associated family protein n=1 Tax=Phomopsis amygdali TaxID=1214568 RepID=UPI0022FE376C|nr:exosome-associated family protein [Diaporthe amygdali]KAJ0123184.1 exosome-associated family protein [Diaporthe amygdali]